MGYEVWVPVAGLLVVAAMMVTVVYLALRGTSASGRAVVLMAVAEVIRALAAVIRSFWGRV
ncbi:hypothetical protein OG613_05930 [Streptomyces sp. NBC_00015]|uniref:hypothetical protein n=1 Tax=unclassified Streptomyces TaxID=2593676 RepID=UPI0022540687|nr:hypothetical protein [Streptomyces sp. NBC_00103]MCX5374800.1 hypothetical protein [Streptomyces sp. NBC_00103]